MYRTTTGYKITEGDGELHSRVNCRNGFSDPIGADGVAEGMRCKGF
jgi:hypothetical protein